MKKIFLFFLIFILLINTASAYTFTNIGGDFKIDYPAGWSYIEEPDGSDQTFTSQTGHASVRVVVEHSEGKSLDEIVGDRIRFLQKNYGISPFSEKYVTVGSLTGKELMFYYYTEQKEYKYRQILLVSGDESFTISAYALTSDFPFFSADFDKIINSFEPLKPVVTAKVTAGYTPVPTPTPQEKGAPTISLHAERTSILVGEKVQLTLSILAPLRENKTKMEYQIILIPPSGMSVTSQDFSETGGQYSQGGTIELQQARSVDIELKANEEGEKDVEATVRYYFEDDKSNIKEEKKSQKIIVSAEAAPTATKGGEPSGDGSAIVGIIAILAIIFTAYIILSKIIKSVKSKISKGEKSQAGEVRAQPARIEEEREAEKAEEEPKREVKVTERKKSAFEIEREKQHQTLPPEALDFDTRNYLNLGINASVSTLDAEMARAESDVLQVQGEIKKNEDVLGKLGTRLVNKEVSEQTYNDLKNKYMRKVSELKSRIANHESEVAKLQKIRSFIQEKGKYYT